MQLVTAEFHLFLPFHLGGLGDVGVSEATAVSVGVLLHGILQCLRNTYVIHYQSTFLLLAILGLKHSVHSGYGLHQVVAAHRLIHIHGGKRWNVKSREPHISHDGYLHRVVVVLELAC